MVATATQTSHFELVNSNLIHIIQIIFIVWPLYYWLINGYWCNDNLCNTCPIYVKFLSWIVCSVYIDLSITLHPYFQIALILACRSMVHEILHCIKAYVQANNKPHKRPFLYQKQLILHIIPGILALLPLDYVQRSLSRCDGLINTAYHIWKMG